MKKPRTAEDSSGPSVPAAFRRNSSAPQMANPMQSNSAASGNGSGEFNWNAFSNSSSQGREANLGTQGGNGMDPMMRMMQAAQANSGTEGMNPMMRMMQAQG